MKPTVKTKLLRFFEDNDITREMIAEETGIAADYLRNMFGQGSDPLTDSAMFKIMQAFPRTRVLLLADDGTEAWHAYRRQLAAEQEKRK